VSSAERSRRNLATGNINPNYIKWVLSEQSSISVFG